MNHSKSADKSSSLILWDFLPPVLKNGQHCHEFPVLFCNFALISRVFHFLPLCESHDVSQFMVWIIRRSI